MLARGWLPDDFTGSEASRRGGTDDGFSVAPFRGIPSGMKEVVNPPGIRPPFARYAHGVVVPAGGRLLVTSGQLGVAPDDTVPDDVEAQAVLCFENIQAILTAAGMTFADVIRFNAYVTDRLYFPVYGAVRSRYVAGDGFASTLVVVSGFTRPEFKIEVEVTAASSPGDAPLF